MGIISHLNVTSGLQRHQAESLEIFPVLCALEVIPLPLIGEHYDLKMASLRLLTGRDDPDGTHPCCFGKLEAHNGMYEQ
jgi:hypothetical protein